MAEIKNVPPTVAAGEVQEKLKAAAARKLDWEAGHDSELRVELNGIAAALDRMGRLKRGGLDNLPETLSTRLGRVIDIVAAHGLFVVPKGELEEWLKEYDVEASKNNKWAWANEASHVIRTSGPREDDIWGFMRGVGDFLAQRLGT